MLSKTDYITYLKHPAWLWLRKHDPDFLPTPDENSQAIIDEGREFEKLAEQIFSDAIHLDRNNYADIQEWADETKALLEQGVDTILQAAFVYDGFLCIADAITKDGDAYTLTEIKATTSPDKEHICDLAFQKTVIEWNGFPVGATRVLHANKEYLRSGNIKVEDIAAFTDVTDKVNKELLSTSVKMREASKLSRSDTMPSDSLRYVGLGAASDYREIFYKLHPDVPEYSIYDLASNKGAGTDKLIGQLEDEGIKLIVDIPESIKLQAHQQDQVRATKLDKPIINKEAIQAFLGDIEFPAYFLDYESINHIFPPFDCTFPYQQVVFQYSLHILNQDGSLVHKEYLHDTNTNPAESIIKGLQEDIGNKGSIIVWNKTFECSRHKEYAKLYPVYAPFFEDLNERTVDLADIFSKRLYLDKKLRGKYSIKKVLPLLCPELSYKELGIQEGSTASRSWREAIVDGTRPDKDQILADLREYCGLDTYAMVAIYNKLHNLILDDRG
jgi:hypothetical protein